MVARVLSSITTQNPSSTATVGDELYSTLYTGVAGELSFTRDSKRLTVHDGVTVGGINVVTVLVGTAAPAVAPKFIGQMYVNTSGPSIYFAKGTASSADFIKVN